MKPTSSAMFTLEEVESVEEIGMLKGAAVAFGLLGMAEAIQARLCPFCGAYGGVDPGDRIWVCEPCHAVNKSAGADDDQLTCIHGMFDREPCDECAKLEDAEPFI